ncbi:Do family serine endopeptidase [Roseomonas alkaliterrae]|uniref:Probable periplasmic serine endoprotease DegP-like n=1 Tax=Neoroseomonas alkaliterrae TaxID=1452450 RepID=A0A840XUU0_9PROT|nr:Do family serine endopeptidase [Neoroseomonas alkaliterrae]MBB5691656.1 serine protease Do [Neoroseomonas alkaliterrae]MBR0676159.1 Do family serine endopeptidase [Neoroseomonas alkaliterrae]
MAVPANRRRPALIAGVLALALGTTALTALPGTAQQAPPVTASAIPRIGPDFADVVERVAPSVVRVITTTRAAPASTEIPRGGPMEEMFRRFGGQAPGAPLPRRGGQGSGFIVDPAGYIVTNAHVVGAEAEVQVALADGRTLPARVVGRDVATDIALLKVEAGAPLPALRFGDSDRTRVGEWVMAMGSPFGLGGSVTAGIVSARGRQIGAGPYDDFIQTDASINPGNSGGPLFNAAGEVVGVNTAIVSPSGGNIGIGFAVPSRMAQSVVAQLREHGAVRRGWLGVSLQPMDAEMAAALGTAEAKGALINAVEPGSPAARAGLRAGDVVTAIDGRAVETPRDLAAGVADVPPGRTATLAILRDGASTEARVEIGSHPANAVPAAKPGQPALGLGLAPRQGGGAEIARVEPGSAAAERGLAPGDVVLRAGEREVRSPQDVAEAIAAARAAGRPSVALQIERDGRSRFVALPLRAA